MDQTWITRYESGATELSQSITGLSRDQLVAFPVPGTWSIAQIAWHVIDSDLILADRMKRTIAEPQPILIGFDESLFTQHLHYQERDLTWGCELFRLNRLSLAELLKLLSPVAFERVGLHNEAGPVTLAQFVEKAVTHWEHHRQFIFQKRQLLGA